MQKEVGKRMKEREAGGGGKKYMYIKEIQPALPGLYSDSVCRKFCIIQTV